MTISNPFIHGVGMAGMGYTPTTNNQQLALSQGTSHEVAVFATSECTDGRQACPECGCVRLTFDHDSSELCCNNCGMVVVEKAEDDMPGVIYPQRGCMLGSKFDSLPNTHSQWDYRTKMTACRNASGFKNRDKIMSMAHTAKIVNRDATNLTEVRGHKVITGLVSRLGMSDALMRAAMDIFLAAQKAGIIQGRAINSMAAASLYVACRQAGVPRTIAEICDSAGIHNEHDCKQTVESAYRTLVQMLNLSMPTLAPSDLIGKAGAALGLKETTVRKAHEIMEAVRAKHIHEGKDPMSIVGGVLRIAIESSGNDEHKTLANIALAVGRTATTVKNRAREIRNEVVLTPA